MKYPKLIAAAMLATAPAAALTLASPASAAPCTFKPNSVTCQTANGSFSAAYAPDGTGSVVSTGLNGSSSYVRTSSGSTINSTLGSTSLQVVKDKTTGALSVTLKTGDHSVSYKSDGPGSIPKVDIN